MAPRGSKIENFDELGFLKIIHLMRDGSGKVAWLESNHFVGSSPTGGDFFFLKSDLNWPYFTISNTLESHIISNLKTQTFVQEMREIAIAIYLCTHTYTCTLKTQNLPYFSV